MNRTQIITFLALAALIIACFMPWVHISAAGITISGIDTTGTRYGKPAYNHFILAAIILCFTVIPKIWAKRFSLLFAAINLAWAIKNFAILPRCEAGECPQKLLGIYIVLIASVLLLITAMFPKLPGVSSQKNK